MADVSVTIRTELLAAIAQCAYTDTDRPAINCVVFRSDEIVATNGHVMVRARQRCPGLAEFGVTRGACFAAIAAQDAHARHHSDYAMQLGVDLEAGRDGESVVMETPHGDRTVTIRSVDGRVFIDIGGGVVLRSPAGKIDNYPDLDPAMVNGQNGDAMTMGFQSKYLDLLDVLSRAGGYFRRGVRAESWDARGAMQFVIPHDADEDDDPIRVVIMRIMGKDEGVVRRSRRRRVAP